MTFGFLSLSGGLCLTRLTLHSVLLVVFGYSLLIFGHPMEATLDLPDSASVLVGHTVGEVFVVDETMSTTTPVVLGVLMIVVFFGISGFLITKAIQTHALLANSMPIPVSRLAGSDTIEDIFKLGKQTTSDEPDVHPDPPASPRATQKFEDVPLATPHRHSTNLHFRKPQMTSLESTDLSTPLLASPSVPPSSGLPCTPDSTLDTPRLPILQRLPLSNTLDVHKRRPTFGVLVNRSPSTSGFAELEVDNEKYLRTALGLAYPDADGWGELGWPGAHNDAVYDRDSTLDGWFMGENEVHGWTFPEAGY